MQDSQIKGGEMHWKCWLGLHNWRMEEKANHLTRYCTRCGRQERWLPGYGGSEIGCWLPMREG